MQNGNGYHDKMAVKNLVAKDDAKNGIMNGGAVKDPIAQKAALHHASGPEGVDGPQRNGSNGINVFVNGTNGHRNGSVH